LPVDYVVIFGETPAEILANYTELTGRPPLLPRWAFGLWLTGYPQEDQASGASNWLPRIASVNSPWMPSSWTTIGRNVSTIFKWRSSLFPDPQWLINRLKADHIHLG